MKLAKDGYKSDHFIEKRRPIVVAIGLAGILFCLVLMINWLGPPQVSVNADMLQYLVNNHHVDWGFVDTQDRLHVHLKEIQSIEDRQQTVRTDRLYAEPTEWDDSELDRWAAADLILIKQRGQEDWEDNPWPGVLFIVCILGAGAYYLWRQAQWNIKYGSPRQQINALDKELKEGNITQEEYQEQLNSITPHL